ncbi:hypothetical protein CPC08DRAFT_720041 [Agrocybe pediades]|nr:hypothetical protein CPC08DRAFT_720041 [Agrocybe pediades]
MSGTFRRGAEMGVSQITFVPFLLSLTCSTFTGMWIMVLLDLLWSLAGFGMLGGSAMQGEAREAVGPLSCSNSAFKPSFLPPFTQGSSSRSGTCMGRHLSTPVEVLSVTCKGATWWSWSQMDFLLSLFCPSRFKVSDLVLARVLDGVGRRCGFGSNSVRFSGACACARALNAVLLELGRSRGFRIMARTLHFPFTAMCIVDYGFGMLGPGWKHKARRGLEKRWKRASCESTSALKTSFFARQGFQGLRPFITCKGA